MIVRFFDISPVHMKTTFKQYVKHLQEGIDHLEDLPVEDFINSIKNIHKMNATDKLDGVNLWFGMDDAGNFFTSREGKNRKGNRFYTQEDFKEVSAHNGMRAAHEALMKNSDSLKSTMKPNDMIEIEVLYGKQPNSIVYGKDNLNYIAFLRSIKTPQNSADFKQDAYKDVHAILNNVKTTVKTPVVATIDGKTLSTSEQVTDWKFVTATVLSSKDMSHLDLSGDIEKLQAYLDKGNQLATDMGESLSNWEVLKSKKRDLSDEKKKIQDVIQTKYKIAIKNKILDQLVRKIKPALQDGKHDDSGVEGVVFLDPETQKQFKVVDKDVFTMLNKFNYQIRNNIAGQVKTDDPLATLAQKGGVFGSAKLRIAKLFNVQGFGAGGGTKRVLEKFKGASPDETAINFAKAVGDVNVNAFKSKIEHILQNAYNELDDYLEDFKKNAKTYSLTLKNGKTIKYTEETINRTLLVFAETRKNIEKLMKDISKTDSIEQLISCLFGAKIKDLHGEGSEGEEE
jgi:hypothetical protein